MESFFHVPLTTFIPRFALSPSLPVVLWLSLGGNLDVSTDAFVQHRLAVEGADINLGKEKTMATLAGKVCTSSDDAGEGLSGVTVSALLAPAKNPGSLSGSTPLGSKYGTSWPWGCL